MTDYPQNYISIRSDYAYILAKTLNITKIEKLPPTREIDPSQGEKEMSAIFVGSYIETEKDIKFIDPETGLTRVVENSDNAKTALWNAGYINIDWAAKTAKSKKIADIAERAVIMHINPKTKTKEVTRIKDYMNERFYYLWQLEKETGYDYDYGGVYKAKTANAPAKEHAGRTIYVEHSTSNFQNSFNADEYFTLNFSNDNLNDETANLQQNAMNDEYYSSEYGNYNMGAEDYTADTENYYNEEAYYKAQNDYYNAGIPTHYNDEEMGSVELVDQDVDKF